MTYACKHQPATIDVDLAVEREALVVVSYVDIDLQGARFVTHDDAFVKFAIEIVGYPDAAEPAFLDNAVVVVVT